MRLSLSALRKAPAGWYSFKQLDVHSQLIVGKTGLEPATTSALPTELLAHKHIQSGSLDSSRWLALPTFDFSMYMHFQIYEPATSNANDMAGGESLSGKTKTTCRE